MRNVVMMLLLVACGGDDADPHALGTCMGWTDTSGNPLTGECEAACKMPPPGTGDTCDTVAQLNCRAFMFGDLRGCCIQDANMGAIRFHECAP